MYLYKTILSFFHLMQFLISLINELYLYLYAFFFLAIPVYNMRRKRKINQVVIEVTCSRIYRRM